MREAFKNYSISYISTTNFLKVFGYKLKDPPGEKGRESPENVSSKSTHTRVKSKHAQYASTKKLTIIHTDP